MCFSICVYINHTGLLYYTISISRLVMSWEKNLFWVVILQDNLIPFGGCDCDAVMHVYTEKGSWCEMGVEKWLQNWRNWTGCSWFSFSHPRIVEDYFFFLFTCRRERERDVKARLVWARRCGGIGKAISRYWKSSIGGTTIESREHHGLVVNKIIIVYEILK